MFFNKKKKCCCENTDQTEIQKEEKVCCGSGKTERTPEQLIPGDDHAAYIIQTYQYQNREAPQIKCKLTMRDYLGALRVRLGIKRDHYKVIPGLYAVGNPKDSSPVFVTANYKLSFDELRKNLEDTDAWVLVLDTHGINVWCASGKGTFGTNELIRILKKTEIEKFVSHKELILPQLSASGVCAAEVLAKTGFYVNWGPVYTKDIQKYLKADKVKTKDMHLVTFSLYERFVLIPVELGSLIKKNLFYILLGLLVLSSICTQGVCFSFGLPRFWLFLVYCGLGVFCGAVVVPLLLPWIPGRAFSVKGALVGVLMGVGLLRWMFETGDRGFLPLALLLVCVALSSYMAMNFTGSTPFTSPSGVEKEMRRAIPVQIVLGVVSLVLWVLSGVGL